GLRARRRAPAALTAPAVPAAAGRSPSGDAPGAITGGRLRVGEVPGLKSVANATAAPASINRRAGACDRRPRKTIVAGSRTATVELPARARIPSSEIAAR